MKHMLCQLQLSNYTTGGTWVLEADSGFMMCAGRIRELLKLKPELIVDVLGPFRHALRTQPEKILSDVFASGRVNWIEVNLVPNALVTRYDFDFRDVSSALQLGSLSHQEYDVVYVNDPQLLRHYKALFCVEGKYQPKFIVHSHFVDCPSNPKFPTEASLWLGQLEAAQRADYNFWQCQSALDEFDREARKTLRDDIVDSILEKSSPWDDGFSLTEILSPVNEGNLRFDPKSVLDVTGGKAIIFVPNRVGGRGRSSDYTRCGQFLFEVLPQLRKRRQDFVVFAGNPNQKFSNDELTELCSKDGYVSLVSDALNRDEYKWVARHSDIVVGLYGNDTYGATASRECIALGCVPLWCACNEYARLAQMANWHWLCDKNLSDCALVADALIETCQNKRQEIYLSKLQTVVKETCSYEHTTPRALSLVEETVIKNSSPRR